MISEKIFAGKFSGFWAETIPFLTPHTVAELNLSGTTMSDGRHEWMKPLRSAGDNSSNDLIAETAFGLFAESFKTGRLLSELCKDKVLIQRIEESAQTRVYGLRRAAGSDLRETNPNMRESIDLASRLVVYFEDFSIEKVVIQ